MSKKFSTSDLKLYVSGYYMAQCILVHVGVIALLIITITKFSNLIGYHQP